MNYILLAIGLGFAVWLIRLGLQFLTLDQIEASKSSLRARTITDAVLGKVRVQDDWLPDARVQGGMYFNKKRNRIEICGKISDDSLRRTFRV